MRNVVQNLEYRGFLGLDTRADTTLVPRPYLIEAENMILKKGVLECAKGNEQWGTLTHQGLPGTLRFVKGFDVGANEYVLLHKGTKVYFGLKGDVSYTAIQDLQGAPVDIVAVDAESEMEALGYDVGSTGELTYKVLFKQLSGCQVLEFMDTSSKWIGRPTGIDTSTVDFSGALGVGSSQPGEYRVRVVAQRIVDGVRVNESAPIGKLTGSSLDDPFYQQFTVPGGGAGIEITVEDSAPDDQITHYGVQITRVLDIVGDTDFSQNGNDPTLYYEALSIPVANLGVATLIDTDVLTLAVVTPNLIGHKPIPGHLISVVTGNLLFFAGVDDNKNRIYHAGQSGFYYHSELYDPYTFHSGGDDDGQLVTGLGTVQDHLLVFKEAKTGIIPNRDLGALLVWRDFELGITHKKAFKNVSEDEVLVYNQDGILRIFNGIRYDRERSIAETTYGFSENIRTKSESIDASSLDFVYDDERMHVVYNNVSTRDVLLFHPRDGYGWTNWVDVGINFPFRMNNGLDFIFEDTGLLYQQNPAGAVYERFLADIAWTVTFALMTSQVSRKDKALIKLIGVDGDFDNDITGEVELDLGRVTGDAEGSLPAVSSGYTVPWYQIPADFQVSGQYIKLTLRGTGRAVIRGIYWGFIEKKSGSMWSQETYTPLDFVTEDVIDETGTAVDEIDESGSATDEISEVP